MYRENKGNMNKDLKFYLLDSLNFSLLIILNALYVEWF